MEDTLDIGLVRFLDKYLLRLDYSNDLDLIVNQISNIAKWTTDGKIDAELFTNYLKNSNITDSQIWKR